jgi:hypothetical protein
MAHYHKYHDQIDIRNITITLFNHFPLTLTLIPSPLLLLIFLFLLILLIQVLLLAGFISEIALLMCMGTLILEISLQLFHRPTMWILT